MGFELTKSFLDDLKTGIQEGRDTLVLETVALLHASDIAEILDELNTEQAVYVFRLLNSEIGADVLVELNEDSQEKLLNALNSTEIAATIIEGIETDDAADLLTELPDTKKEEILALIEDEEQASDIADLLNYEEDTAGSLMAKELIKVNAKMSVRRALAEMRLQAQEIEHVYSIYVTDDEDKLLGTLSLKSLLFSKKDSTIEDMYEKGVRSVEVDTDTDEVVSLIKKYDLVALPVVNKDQVLLGRITVDDVVDLISEEAEKDYQLATGLSDRIDNRDNLWQLTKARLPWLLVGLLGSLLSGRVIDSFTDQIMEYTQLVLFIPLIAAMGGNVGVQSSAIVVQALASNSFQDSIGRRLGKEVLLGFTNAIVLSGIIFLFNLGFGVNWQISVTLIISLAIVIISAALIGTVVPYFLEKMDVNPAIATGPFITTSNDIVGVFIYFTIAKYFLGF